MQALSFPPTHPFGEGGWDLGRYASKKKKNIKYQGRHETKVTVS